MKVGAGTLTTAVVVGALAGWIAAVAVQGDEAGVRLEQVAPMSTPAASSTPPTVTPQETTTTAPTVPPQPIITAIPPHVETTTQEPHKAPQRASAQKETTVTQNEPEKAQQGGGSMQYDDVQTVAPDTVTARGYGAPAPTLPSVPDQPNPPAYTDGP